MSKVFSFLVLAAVTTGFPTTSGGQRHSSDTPTSESINPSSAIISVALGRNEQIRIPANTNPDPSQRHYIARRIAEGKSCRESVRLLKRYLARTSPHGAGERTGV